MTNKYVECIEQLNTTGKAVMRCAGNSMLPILSNPSINHYERQDTYRVGNIVFCKVNGRYIDAHLITKIGRDGRYMIANNHGHENGWTNTIYGRVVRSFDRNGKENKL